MLHQQTHWLSSFLLAVWPVWQVFLLAAVLWAPAFSLPRRADSCAWPPNTAKYAVITKEDAALAAHEIYTGVHIGGDLISSADISKNIASHVSQISFIHGSVDEAAWNFQAGKTNQSDLSFADFESLALELDDTASGEYLTQTTSQGGVYTSTDACHTTINMDDYRNTDWQGEDDGRTLVVFKDAGTICISKTASGRPFGGTVLAPFAHVVILGDAQFVDGSIIARSVSSPGVDNSSVQLHGDLYLGGFCCGAVCSTGQPTLGPTLGLTLEPTLGPTLKPSLNPTDKPTLKPTLKPTEQPSTECEMTDGEGCGFFHFDIKESLAFERAEILKENCDEIATMQMSCPVTCNLACYSDGDEGGSGSDLLEWTEISVETAMFFLDTPTTTQQATITDLCVQEMEETFENVATAWMCTITQSAGNRRAGSEFLLDAKGFSSNPEQFLSVASAPETLVSFQNNFQARMKAHGMPKPVVLSFEGSSSDSEESNEESNDSSDLSKIKLGAILFSAGVVTVIAVGVLLVRFRCRSKHAEFPDELFPEDVTYGIDNGGVIKEELEAPLSPASRKAAQASAPWFSGKTKSYHSSVM